MPAQIRPLISNYQQHQNYIEGNVTITVGTFTDELFDGISSGNPGFTTGNVTVSSVTTQNGTSIPGFVSGTLTNNDYKIAISSASATATNGVVDLEKILQETVITLADNTDRDLFLTFTANLEVGPDSGNLTTADSEQVGSCLVRRSEEILPTVPYTVDSITVTDGGSGYTAGFPPTVSIIGEGWSNATATASLTGDAVSSIAVTNGGSGSTDTVQMQFTGGTGSGVTATATVIEDGDLSSNVVLTEDGSPVSLPAGISSDGLTLENAGTFTYGKMVNEWYANITLQEPVVSTLTNGAGTRVWPNVSVVSPSWIQVSQVSDTTLNDNIVSSDPAEMTRIDGSPDPAVIVYPEITNVSGYVDSVTVTAGGSGYVSAPTVTLVGAGGSNFNATAQISDGAVTGVTIIGGGASYNTSGTITFTGGGGAGATATYTTASSDFVTDVCEATINGVTVQCRTMNGVQETVSSSTATNGIPGEEAIFTGGQFWSDADDVVADINSASISNLQATVTGASSNQIQLKQLDGSAITIVNVQTDYGSTRPGSLTDDPFAGDDSVTGLPLSTSAKTFNTELTNTISLRGDSTAMGSAGSVDVVLNINRGTETIVDTNPLIAHKFIQQSGVEDWVTHSVKVNNGANFNSDTDFAWLNINGVSFKLGTFHGVTYDIGDTFTANAQVYYATASDVVRDINEANIPYVTAEAVLSTTNPAKYVYPNVVGGIPAPGTHTNFLRLKHSQGGDITFDYPQEYNTATVQKNVDDQGQLGFTPDGQLEDDPTGSPYTGYVKGSTEYHSTHLATYGYSNSILGVRQKPLQVSTTDQLVTVKLTFQ